MRKMYYLLALALCFSFASQAQNTVEVDANADFVGFMNVFETPANGQGYVFGDSWGVPDLKTTVDAGAGTITLQPNFNTYDAADPFWVDQTTLEGNKFMEANTFVEDNSLAGEELTFNGYTNSNDLDANYEVMAFIKVFNADFSVLKIETAPLVAGQNFSINYTNVEGADTVVQYGFFVAGINANPVDESALGSVVVSAPLLGTNDVAAINVSVYPNPSNSVWNIETTNQNISTVEIYNILGKKVQSTPSNSTSVSINNESLAKGIYLAKISTDAGDVSVKLIKQ
ncbi:MAG: T9SS type A sorting domain-containing protein [Bacteroidetes bacterium]|nr:T9SS type A sorting domain-containing protein [Bacteroidota bacterium]